jgi:hypothetical protein
MKQFDLEKALAGAKLLCIGHPSVEILSIVHLKHSNKLAVELRSTHGITINFYQPNGQFFSTTESSYDLVMAPVKKTRYYNLWGSPSFHYTVYDTKEDAIQDFRGLTPNSKGSRTWPKLNTEPLEITTEED